jgi:hypothetical protein
MPDFNLLLLSRRQRGLSKRLKKKLRLEKERFYLKQKTS